jgi:hypothetical protein
VDNGNGAGRVEAGFTVTASALPALGVTKAFDPTTIAPGGISLLTVTLTNPNATPVTGAAFVDTYPTNLQTTGVPAAATTCVGGVANAAPNSLSLTGGTVPASGSCVVTVAVTSSVATGYSNVIPAGGVTAANAAPSVDAAAAELTVAAPTAVPALSSWALAFLAGALGLLALRALRQA